MVLPDDRSLAYWVILPTYCEADNLPRLLEQLKQPALDINILIVDDNSPDGTGDIAALLEKENPHIHLIRRASKQGLGSAYLTGFVYALDAGADVVVTMDSDLSHDPWALSSLIAALDRAGCVVGSRYVAGGAIENWPVHRRVLSAAANRFVRVLFGMPVNDCTSGYRLYRRQVVEDILRNPPQSQGYSFIVEALFIAIRGPLSVREAPIRFVERISGTSKMGLREIIHGAWRLISLWAEIRLTNSIHMESAGENEKSGLDYT